MEWGQSPFVAVQAEVAEEISAESAGNPGGAERSGEQRALVLLAVLAVAQHMNA